jgi:hypothetical protein
MRSRRQFFRLSIAALLTSAGAARLGAQPSPPQQVWLPLVLGLPAADDAPILGPASGTAGQAVAWLAPRALVYTAYDIWMIVDGYQATGEAVGLDWFLALAQMAHETGSLTSWWSQRPRRNPAGIGVTGRVQAGAPDAPPGPGWTWDNAQLQWREGWSFPTWVDDGIPAHLGRLLAYALRDDQANTSQAALIARALSYRPLPASYRGAAPTIVGLNGRWAVPGQGYGQAIVNLAARMRGG